MTALTTPHKPQPPNPTEINTTPIKLDQTPLRTRVTTPSYLYQGLFGSPEESTTPIKNSITTIDCKLAVGAVRYESLTKQFERMSSFITDKGFLNQLTASLEKASSIEETEAANNNSQNPPSPPEKPPLPQARHSLPSTCIRTLFSPQTKETSTPSSFGQEAQSLTNYLAEQWKQERDMLIQLLNQKQDSLNKNETNILLLSEINKYLLSFIETNGLKTDWDACNTITVPSIDFTQKYLP